MAHETSRTIERDGKFYNVNGTTGYPLPPLFHFEREAYDTLDEAVDAARKRSRLGGGPETYPGESDRPYATLEHKHPTALGRD
jgi:hypothetical protein